MKPAIILFSLLTLCACAEFSAIYSAVVVSRETSDVALDRILVALCDTTILKPAIRRKFDSPDKMRVYAELCGNTDLLTGE